MSKAVKYFFIIFLTVLEILGVIIFGILFLASSIGITSFLPGTNSFNTTTASPNPAYEIISDGKVVWGILCAVCIVFYPFITNLRQRYRDEYEYDENGVSKKRGHFSQLSKKERDEIERHKMIDNERLLDEATVKKITREGSNNPNEDMKKLIGLNNVKAEMHEIVARIIYENEKERKKKSKKNKGDSLSSMHMIFMGPPGTGKTTVARIMTGFLYETGYIKKNKCVEIDGNFFAGTSRADSTKKTQMLITRALGGVLFIDEAYALLNSGGQEVIATLIKEMEDRKNEFVVILAGYDNEMKRLINSNPGIESRIKRYLWFGDYSVEDLRSIFISMAGEEGFVVSSEIVDDFTDRIIYEKKQPNFGNARTVRNLLDKIIDKHAVNMLDGINPPETKFLLTQADMPQIDAHKHT